MDVIVSFRADRLRSLREDRRLSQRELARLCDLGETQIHKYETGEAEPSAKNLKILADKLEVSTDFLLGRTEDPRGQIGDNNITADEHTIIETFRREGWRGVARLSIERI